jgi:hypothetical protein
MLKTATLEHVFSTPSVTRRRAIIEELMRGPQNVSEPRARRSFFLARPLAGLSKTRADRQLAVQVASMHAPPAAQELAVWH